MILSLSIFSFGQVFSFGANDHGQLGVPTAASHARSDTPRLLGGALRDERVRAVVCGGLFTFAVTERNEAFAWGDGCVRVRIDQCMAVHPMNLEPWACNDSLLQA
jgi:alpha-tubulin suppressor-like RCC1 family protein